MKRFKNFKSIEEFIDDINYEHSEDELQYINCHCSDILVQFHTKNEFDKLIEVLDVDRNFLIRLSIDIEYDINNLRLCITDYCNEFENVCEELIEYDCDIFEFSIKTLRLSEILI